MSYNQILADKAKARAEKVIALIKSAPADSKVAVANAHVLGDSSGTYGGGILEVSGVYSFSADVSALVFTTGDNYTFDGCGTGWIVAVGDCAVAGYFVVPVNSLAGPANFNLELGAGEEGGVEMDFYNPTNNAYLGSLAGYVEGLGAANVSGSGMFIGI